MGRDRVELLEDLSGAVRLLKAGNASRLQQPQLLVVLRLLGSLRPYEPIFAVADHWDYGLAHHLFEHLLSQAGADGMENIVCEVNKESPNPGSDALHARIGSLDLGQARLVHADETVRYLMKFITTP